MTEKVVGTRMDADVVERLEALAVLNDRTVSQLVRLAVEAFLEAEEDKLRPFNSSDIATLSSMLGMGAEELVSSAFLLRGIVPDTVPISAVYLLVETEQRECYVGSSVSFRKRVASHLSGIRAGKHENSSLERWSIDSTVVVVLESLPNWDDLRQSEQRWIDKLKGSKKFTLTNERQSFDAVRRSSRPTTTGRGSGSNSAERHSKKPTPLPLPEPTPLPESVHLSNQAVAQATVPQPVLTKEEEFHQEFILETLLPALKEQRLTRDILDAVDEADAKYGTEGRVWATAFIKQYNSPWLAKWAATGKFPDIEKLLARRLQNRYNSSTQ